MVRVILILAICSSAFAQAFTLRDPSFVGNAVPRTISTFTPTNLPGTATTAVSWWVASDYTTNSTVGTWNSRLGGYIATNATAASMPSRDANGLHFGGAAWLDSITYTQAQPHTIVAIYAWTNASGTKVWMCSGVAGQPTLNQATAALSANAGTSATGFIRNALTNKFMVVEALLDAANTRMWTNTIPDVTATACGTATWTNIVFGAANSHSFNGLFSVLEVATYAGTFSSTDKSNFVYYATNTYPSLVTWP